MTVGAALLAFLGWLGALYGVTVRAERHDEPDEQVTGSVQCATCGRRGLNDRWLALHQQASHPETWG